MYFIFLNIITLISKFFGLPEKLDTRMAGVEAQK